MRRRLRRWQEETKDRIGELKPALAKVTKAVESARAASEGLAKAKKLLPAARTKLTYVVEDGSYGAHNFDYVTEMLDGAETEIGTCRSLVAAWSKPPAGELGQ